MTKTESRLNRDGSDSQADVFRGPTAEETWQQIRKWYCRSSRHVIVDAPGYPEYLRKEVVVVEAPRRNMKTVRIDIDGTQFRWPIGWLRPIISETMRQAMAEEAARRRPDGGTARERSQILRGPRNFSEGQLKRVGVTLTDPDGQILHCDRCGQGWQPMIISGGRRSRLF